MKPCQTLFLSIAWVASASGASFIPSSSSNSRTSSCSTRSFLYLPDEAASGKNNVSNGKANDETFLVNNGKMGRVSMVGSGPGDPDLLTIAAAKVIEDPDALIIADRLVSPEIIAMCKGEVRTARKLPGCADKAQQEIYDWCREGLMDGKHVVRLKIGDPFVFGRGGEEVLEFRKMGVEPKVIPGVSAAFAAPLLGGIPVTHRGISNQVVMCTGYGRNGTSPDLIQYHKEQTVVFLMAVGRLRELCDNLCNLANYPRDTPVAVVEKAGCPEQRTVVGDLNTIADYCIRYDIKPPSTIVVGEVVDVLLNEGVGSMEERVQGLVDMAVPSSSDVVAASD